MTFYILLNHLTTLFLSVNLLTTLSFESEIQGYIYGGSKEEVFVQVTNGHKTLAMKPLTERNLSNLLVITKNRKYYFNLSQGVQNPHQFIEVKDGLPSHALKKVASTKDYELFEGESSMLFVNRKESEVMVNGLKVDRREFLSKGVPIIYEGQRIYN